MVSARAKTAGGMGASALSMGSFSGTEDSTPRVPRRRVVSKIVIALVVAILAWGPSTPSHEPPAPKPVFPKVHWHVSHALGSPSAGRLVGGVRLPSEGRHFFTWDPLGHRSPSPGWRRVGTDGLVRLTLRVIGEYAADHPGAPRVGIGDLSRPHGGDFGPQFGGPGHVSHQNGLDVDVYYPRRDRRERPPLEAAQANLRLAQDLVDRFVAAGAEVVFVGPSTGLVGPTGVVRVLPHHDNHLHVRLPPWLA
jgi:murein endopeptidase